MIYDIPVGTVDVDKRCFPRVCMLLHVKIKKYIDTKEYQTENESYHDEGEGVGCRSL